MQIVLLLIIMAFEAYAQTSHLAILGGGGEGKGPTTIFDKDLKHITNFAKSNPEWIVTSSFNGGHTETENIIKTNTNLTNQNFTKKTFEQIIKTYESKILKGEIKSGDQLLIHINTHGARRDESSEKTHKIATAESALENYETIGGASVGLDKLKKLTELADQKGIKLAILDFSCHSGSTLNLASKNTCVITSTGPNHYGYTGSDLTFTSLFNSKLEKGKSLEEIYLEARENYSDKSFPMISSPQGKFVQEKIYDQITPYLYSYDPKHDKQTPWLENEFATGKYCQTNENYQKLISEVEQLLKVNNTVNAREADLAFKKATEEYFKYLEEIRKDMEVAGFPIMNKENTFCSEIPKEFVKKLGKSKECMTYKNKELMSINFDSIISAFQKSSHDSKLAHEKAEYKAMIEFLKKAKTAREKLILENPKLAEIEKFWQKYPDRQQKTEVLGHAVGTALQKVYSTIYKSTPIPGPNPCRDFIL